MNRAHMTITAYLCSKCNRMHKVTSSLGKQHLGYAPKLPPNSSYAKVQP